jgi:hypothetical protein
MEQVEAAIKYYADAEVDPDDYQVIDSEEGGAMVYCLTKTGPN